MGLDKTAVGYQEEGVIKLLKDIRDGLANGVIRPNRPDNDDDRPDDDDNDRPDNDDDNRPDNNDDDRSDGKEEKIVIKHLLNEIDRINDINKKYKDTINNINGKNDDYFFKKKKEQNDDIEKLKKETIDNKKITKDILDKAGKKINKFHQERLKYFNDLNYELEKNSELLKKIREKESLINDYIMHIRYNTNEDRLEIDVLN